MTTFLFTYRTPKDSAPGGEGNTARAIAVEQGWQAVKIRRSPISWSTRHQSLTSISRTSNGARRRPTRPNGPHRFNKPVNGMAGSPNDRAIGRVAFAAGVSTTATLAFTVRPRACGLTLLWWGWP